MNVLWWAVLLSGSLMFDDVEDGGLGRMEDYLMATAKIDHDHPRIKETAARLTAGLSDPRDRALAVFRFVRDEIRFGFRTGFYDQKASIVLSRRIGYCNTKSTLFTALLRAAGVPARIVYVDIDAQILRGLINPGTAFVDHSYTEVWLDGAWMATDAYIVDPPLFKAARARLQREGRLIGYGVHVNGSNTWDGRSPSFSQFHDDGSMVLTRKYFGVFADVDDFYRKADGVHNRLGWGMRQMFGLFAAEANRQIEKLRDEGP